MKTKLISFILLASSLLLLGGCVAVPVSSQPSRVIIIHQPRFVPMYTYWHSNFWFGGHHYRRIPYRR